MPNTQNLIPSICEAKIQSRLSVGPKSKVLVVGLGTSGLWTARWLIGQGADVIVTEMKRESELDPDILRELLELGVI